MGRRKLEIKRIKDKSSRLVAFSKRRTGLFKKARQLSVLCDVDVAVVVFSDSGKLYDFCSGGANKKHWFVGQETTTQEGACQDIGFSNPCTRFRTCHQLLQSVTRVDEEPNEVSVTDMVELEEELSSALMHTRSRKTQMMMDRISTFHENEKKLTQQNLQLKQNQQVAESEQKDDVEIDVNDGDGDGGGDVVELAKDDNYQTNTSSLFTLPLFKE